MAKPKVAKLIAAIQECNGNISAVASSFKAPRSTVYSWINGSETAQQALADARERRVDIAEDVLGRKVEEGDMQAIFYTLNNQAEARARGWAVKQTDITSGGDKITIALNWGDNADD